MKFRLWLFLRKLDHIHLIQFFLAGHGHIAGGNSGLIPRDKIFQFADFLLLAAVGSFFLRLFHLVDFQEMIVVSHIAVQFPVFHVIDQIYDTVQKRNVMGDQKERVLVFLKITGQPADMFRIQIIGRLVQQKDIRFFQKQLSQKDLRPLASAQFLHISVQADLLQAESPCDLLHLGIDHIKIMQHQRILDRPERLHHLFQLLFRSPAHPVTDLIHLLFQFQKPCKRAAEHIPDRHSPFQHCVLIQVADADILRPLDLSLIRHQLPGDNVHKRRLSFPVGTDQPDMFTFQQPERNILKNRSVPETVRQVFHIQNTHFLSPQSDNLSFLSFCGSIRPVFPRIPTILHDTH